MKYKILLVFALCSFAVTPVFPQDDLAKFGFQIRFRLQGRTI